MNAIVSLLVVVNVVPALNFHVVHLTVAVPIFLVSLVESFVLKHNLLIVVPGIFRPSFH